MPADLCLYSSCKFTSGFARGARSVRVSGAVMVPWWAGGSGLEMGSGLVSAWGEWWGPEKARVKGYPTVIWSGRRSGPRSHPRREV
jgi:hypothetical protein